MRVAGIKKSNRQEHPSHLLGPIPPRAPGDETTIPIVAALDVSALISRLPAVQRALPKGGHETLSTVQISPPSVTM